MKRDWAWRAFASVAVIPLFVPLEASAQGAPEDVEEITVTARKREESLQDVPVAVSAFSGDGLAQKGIESSEGLVGRVPSLSFSQNQTFGPTKSETYIVLRGIGATAALESSVAVFIDGVYQPKMNFDAGFLDLERMEVLRGPQGALFGRNTQGGALNLVTHKPDAEFRGKVQAEAGSYSTLKLKGSASGPLSDQVFLGVSGAVEQTDGYFDNVTLGKHQDKGGRGSARATLRALPSDTFEVILTAGFSHAWGGQLGAGVPEDGAKYKIFDGEVRNLKDNVRNAALTMNWDLGPATLTSITGAVKTETAVFWDWDGSAVANGNFQSQKIDQSIVSEEVRLASNPGNGNIDWLAGLYFFRSVYDQDRDFGLADGTGSTFPPIFSPDNVVDEQARFVNRGFAVFGQATWRPVENLDLTVGGRYSREKVKSRQWGSVIVVNLGSSEIFDTRADATFSRFSPMASVSYRWNDNIMTYATIAEGFKAGGFQKYPASNIASGIPFDNELSMNYEVGIKSSLLDRKLTFNAAAFVVKVKDQQLGTIREIGGIPVESIDNVGRSTSQGFEIETTARPFPGLSFSGSFSYVDAKFDKYFNPGTGVDRAGERIPYVPKWSGSAQLDYTHAVGGGLDLVWTAQYRYVGSSIAGNGAPPFDPFLDIDSYDIWDASVRLESDRWELALFVDNLFDEYNISRKWAAPFQTVIYETPLPPRHIGVRATLKW